MSSQAIKTNGGTYNKLEIELPYDPAIPLLGVHTEETKIFIFDDFYQPK